MRFFKKHPTWKKFGSSKNKKRRGGDGCNTADRLKIIQLKANKLKTFKLKIEKQQIRLISTHTSISSNGKFYSNKKFKS